MNNLYNAFAMYSFIRDTLLERDTKPKGSLAFKFYKVLKHIDSERELLRETLEKEWLEKYGTTLNDANAETKEKMQEEFMQESMAIHFSIAPFITERDIEKLDLTIDEIVKLNSLILEE